MKFQYNDGGRLAAGFKGSAGDCVTRAIAIATGLPYQQVYDDLSHGCRNQRLTKRSRAKSSARDGVAVRRKWFKDYMTRLGWRYTACMGIGTGCKVHLNASELPSGRLIVQVSKHYCAVIDGVIHDTHNPSERGVTIFPRNYLGNIPLGAIRQPNGDYYYSPERCVYGYWQPASATK